MSAPRIVLPDSTDLVTRRTLRRHHLFAPDAAIRGLYVYALAAGTYWMRRVHAAEVSPIAVAA